MCGPMRQSAPDFRGCPGRLRCHRTPTQRLSTRCGPGTGRRLLLRAGTEAGREALTAGRPDRTRELLGRALARWRGPMLAASRPGPSSPAERRRTAPIGSRP
ncbi:BTAD domain-containing putative transcriptional regulator [Micromonospora sp. A202]|uniref:BTAD domain-containing putative transcriptional regulator n=1 Tax=Micromonospora sp. A202 TaxID=2572899 RepID=UPI0011525966